MTTLSCPDCGRQVTRGPSGIECGHSRGTVPRVGPGACLAVPDATSPCSPRTSATTRSARSVVRDRRRALPPLDASLSRVRVDALLSPIGSVPSSSVHDRDAVVIGGPGGPPRPKPSNGRPRLQRVESALLGRRQTLDRDGQITDVDRIAAEKGSTGNPHLRVGDPPETAPLLRSVRSARPWTDSPVESRSRSCHSDLISETLFRPLPLGLCRRLVAAARRSGSIHSP